ncbi:flagellar filament capping protein FliD [Uliginosibacterium sp. H1]|uniref:flagellar filament capping protein FliD n=1 Tax=Uliginosibacterium sp. H1 TaxID=3114757 RepID=UPI002E1818AB|nr:flagellar filament capping protein FliD [Uliginosibacterium sp. H1]
MAGTITSLGVGSNLNLEDMVTQLMQLERQPITQLQTRSAGATTQLSALGSLKSALSNLQTAAKALSTGTTFNAFKTSVAATDVASATASGGAVAGQYSIEVTQLAQFQKVKSAAVTNGATIGTGTLTLELGTTTGGAFTADGTKTKNIVINSSNNTLAGLRDAINASGAEVSASIVNEGTSSRLVLTSKNSGTTNTFRLSGLSGFDYNPASETGSMEKITSALDAKVTIDSIEVTRSSNTITDAINGVTLNLTKTNTGSPTTLAVTTDAKAVEDKVSAFIKAYNDVNSFIRTQTSYDATSKKAGTLNGDAAVRSIQSQLRATVSGTLSGGTLTRLSEVGVKIAVDGSLSLDSTKFQAALADPTKNVSALFADTNGVAGFGKQIDSKISDFLGTEGVLTSRTDGINKTITNYTKRIEALEVRMETIEARYRRQFSALDTMVASYTSTGNYLTQQLAALAANS